MERRKRPLRGEQKQSTTELLGNIRRLAEDGGDDEFASFMRRSKGEFSYWPKVGQYLKEIVETRGGKIDFASLSEKTGVSKSYLHQIIPAKSKPPKTTKDHPSRKMLLAIALALKFSVDETQHLLKYAREPELYPRSPFDSALLYALERGSSVVETNILLQNIGEELLIFGDGR